jgi:large subunit ribosomal protein L35
MKQKTNSGAKKRLRVTGKGKVKRKQSGLIHMLVCKKSKRKRQLGPKAHVHSANQYQTDRLLVL